MMESLLAIERLLLLLALATWTGQVVLRGRSAPAEAPPAPLRSFAGVVAGLFVATLLWQACWALAGQHVDSFHRVEKYDPRAWRLAGPTSRRAVVDRSGVLLVTNLRQGTEWRRSYPLGAAAAHLTGYFSRRYGKTGIEAAADERLSTWRQPAWATLANALRQGNPAPPPLQLTIDARLQRAAAEALAGRRGAVVVLNPAAGDVLALVSAPSFDPATVDETGLPGQPERPDSPLLDRALHGLYPPGSTFKPIVAATALSRGIPATTRYEPDPAGYLPPYDTKRIRDFEAGELAAEGKAWHGHGSLTLGDAMACSSNGYFAWLGVQLGADSFLREAHAFGLDQRWDLAGGDTADLLSEPGRLPELPLKPGDAARCAIGQHDLLVTPLGLAVVASTVANYGRLVPPRLRLDRDPATPWPVLAPGVARQLQTLMAGVVTNRLGTGHGLRLPNLPVAAKTGSAENPHGAAHGWVIAFAPVQRASLALAVVVENGGTGSAAAVPVARKVLLAARAAGYFGRDRG